MMTREQMEMIVWHYEPLHKTHTPLVNRDEWVEEKVDETIANYLKRTEQKWEDLTLGEQNDMTWEHQSSAHMTYDGLRSENYHTDEKFWKERGPFYVVCMRWDQCYGGAEEGGWWYSAPSLVKWCAVPTYEMGEWLAKTLTEKSKEKKYEPVYSALGGDDSVNSNYPEGYIPSGWVGARDLEFRVSHEVVEPQFERPYYE